MDHRTTESRLTPIGHPAAENASLVEGPTTAHELAQDHVARTVRDAWLASAELYRLTLNPETASLLAKEEGDLWSIHGRVKSVLDEIRNEHA